MSPARGAARCLPALLVALAALAPPGCAPSRPPPGDGPRTILLLGCRTFGGSTRVATLLDDMAAATDVLGETRFVVESPPDCRPSDLPQLLARHPEAAIAIAILGDLSVLDGVDPSLPPQAVAQLTSRRVPRDALLEVLGRLEQTARAQGTRLLLATAPLGRPARVEVPELEAVAELLRERGAVLDLARDFEALEPAPLFANDFDRLDDFGHDELANALFAHCREDGGPIPTRNAAERAARLQARTLAAFHADRQDEFAKLAAQALDESVPAPPGAAPPETFAVAEKDADAAPMSARHAVRLAAIASARDGLVAAAPRWMAIEGPAEGVPGLALGRALVAAMTGTEAAALSATPSATPSGTPSAVPGATPEGGADAGPDAREACTGDLEAGLVDVLDALQRVDPSTRAMASRCVEAHPERIEAWIILELVSFALPPHEDVRGDARRHMALCPRGSVPEALVTRIFRHWPGPVDDLPALLLAERPHEKQLPTGPLLETARRRAALGYVDHALELLRDGLRDLNAPPAWERERLRIDALPRS